VSLAVEAEFVEQAIDTSTALDLDLPPRVAQQDLHDAC
jgi:hypothetical protein